LILNSQQKGGLNLIDLLNNTIKIIPQLAFSPLGGAKFALTLQNKLFLYGHFFISILFLVIGVTWNNCSVILYQAIYTTLHTTSLTTAPSVFLKPKYFHTHDLTPNGLWNISLSLQARFDGSIALESKTQQCV